MLTRKNLINRRRRLWQEHWSVAAPVHEPLHTPVADEKLQSAGIHTTNSKPRFFNRDCGNH